MKFFIYPKLDGRHYEIIVEHYGVTWNTERFKVFGKSTLLIESNRPLFRNKGIKHRRPDYKLISGKITANYHLEAVIKEIDAWVLKNLD